MSETGKTATSWNKLFSELDILYHVEKDGIYAITADTIRKYREPRLMAKFDHKSNLPGIFQDNNLSILPNSRSSYVISNFDAYHKFEEKASTVKYFSLPSYIESIDKTSITSETFALNIALASGILSDFLEDENIIPTVEGRMGSGIFNFCIDRVKSNSVANVKVENAQLEIDGAFEGRKYLSIFEAKLDISSDFLVRQLYYPLRAWSKRIDKPINTVFLTYSNGIYRLYNYAFEDPNNYNSLQLRKYQEYSVCDSLIKEEDIRNIQSHIEIAPEPTVTFPQADSFERVINTCELLADHDFSRGEFQATYDFDNRQVNYYTDAGRYLGLIKKYTRTEYEEKESGGEIKNISKLVVCYTLTKEGRKLMEKNYTQRQLTLCRAILSHRIFHKIFGEYLAIGKFPSNERMDEIMKECGLADLSDSTRKRRRQTVVAWLRWIIGLYSDYRETP